LPACRCRDAPGDPEQPLIVRGEKDPVRRQQLPRHVKEDALAFFVGPAGHRDVERDLADWPPKSAVEPAVALVEKGRDIPPDLDQRRQRARAHRLTIVLGSTAHASERFGGKPPYRGNAALAGIGAEQLLAPQLDPRAQHCASRSRLRPFDSMVKNAPRDSRPQPPPIPNSA
jgi:hypothetical protein